MSLFDNPAKVIPTDLKQQIPAIQLISNLE